MAMGNPAVRRMTKQAQKGAYAVQSKDASYGGVYSKAAIFALLTIICAVATELVLFKRFNTYFSDKVFIGLCISLAVCVVLVFILSFVISFIPKTAKVLGFVYAVLQGALLGVLSLIVDLMAPGVAFAALIGTVIVFALTLVMHYFLRVRISSRLLRGLIVVLFSVLLVQLLMFLLSRVGFFSFRGYFWLQILVSSAYVIWATIMLFMDISSIDALVLGGADKKFEWSMAFSLVTTLTYLYVELLELIVRLIILLGHLKG